MRGAWARAAAGAVLCSVLLGSLLVGAVLLGEAVEPALLVGMLGALLCVWGSHRVAPGTGRAVVPAVAARDRRRALARRGVPAQRDPDAAGHTRSRAPSGLLPAV